MATANPHYIQTCALPDICNQCGEWDRVAEVRNLLKETVIARLCIDCLERSEYL